MSKDNVLQSIKDRPLFIKHDMHGVARSEPVEDEYGSQFSLFMKDEQGEEYQFDTSSEKAYDFVAQGTEVDESEYNAE